MKPDEPGSPSLPPSRTEPASKWTAITAAAALLITAINGFVGYVGWNSAKDIREVAEQAKEKQKGIDQILEGSYFLYARAVEREVTELVAELPGVELMGTRTRDIKDAIRKARDNLTILETFIKSENRLPTRHLVDGFIALDSKNCAGAIQSLNLYSKEAPVKYHLLGIAHTNCGNLDQADAAFAKVLEISPFKPTDRLKAKAVNNLANNDVRRKKYADALSRYDHALKIDPATYGVHYNKAAVFSLSGRYSEALQSLCEFARNHDGSVADEMDTDRDFDAFKGFLAKDGDWRSVLGKRLEKCR